MQAVHLSNELTRPIRSVLAKIDHNGFGCLLGELLFRCGESNFDTSRFFTEDSRSVFIQTINERCITFLGDIYSTSLVGHVYNGNLSIVKNALWYRSTHTILSVNRASLDRLLGNKLTDYLFEVGCYFDFITVIENFITTEIDQQPFVEEVMPALLETMHNLSGYIYNFKALNPHRLVDVIFAPSQNGSIGSQNNIVMMVEETIKENHAGFQILFD